MLPEKQQTLCKISIFDIAQGHPFLAVSIRDSVHTKTNYEKSENQLDLVVRKKMRCESENYQ